MNADASFWQVPAGELEQLQRTTFVVRTEHHAELASTNSWALHRVTQSPPDGPLLILADRQTAGRGRGVNSWWSAPGALTFSIVLPRPQVAARGDTVSCLSLTTGIAVCEALHLLCPGLDAALKWPNDVYVQGRKISGILVETVAAAPRYAVVGIGLNVNNDLAQAPEELRARATSLVEISGYRIELVTVLRSVLGELARLLALLTAGTDVIYQQWDAHCMLTGRQVVVAMGARRTRGICRGIGPDGALLVETPLGVEPCVSGEVVHWQ